MYAKGNQLYVLSGGTLQKELLRETHDDIQWVGHPSVEHMMALLSKSYCWPKMEDDVEFHVKTYFVCQQNQTERKALAGLL